MNRLEQDIKDQRAAKIGDAAEVLDLLAATELLCLSMAREPDRYGPLKGFLATSIAATRASAILGATTAHGVELAKVHRKDHHGRIRRLSLQACPKRRL